MLVKIAQVFLLLFTTPADRLEAMLQTTDFEVTVHLGVSNEMLRIPTKERFCQCIVVHVNSSFKSKPCLFWKCLPFSELETLLESVSLP